MKKMICKICFKEIPFDNEQKCRSGYTIKISSGYPGKSIKTHCCSECYPLLLGFLNIHDKKSDYFEELKKYGCEVCEWYDEETGKCCSASLDPCEYVE